MRKIVHIDAAHVLDADGNGRILALDGIICPHGDGRDDIRFLIAGDPDHAVDAEFRRTALRRPTKGNDVAHFDALTLRISCGSLRRRDALIERSDENERTGVVAALLFALHEVVGASVLRLGGDGDRGNAEHVGHILLIHVALDDERHVDAQQRDEDEAGEPEQDPADDAAHSDFGIFPAVGLGLFRLGRFGRGRLGGSGNRLGSFLCFGSFGRFICFLCFGIFGGFGGCALCTFGYRLFGSALGLLFFASAFRGVRRLRSPFGVAAGRGGTGLRRGAFYSLPDDGGSAFRSPRTDRVRGRGCGSFPCIRHRVFGHFIPFRLLFHRSSL